MTTTSKALLLTAALLFTACTDTSGPTGVDTASSVRPLASSKQSDFTLLANAAVTCTDGTITGDVGTFAAAPVGAVTLSNCPLTGQVRIGDGTAIAAYGSFLSRYSAMAPTVSTSCTVLSGTLSGVTLTPGTYCFPAAATLTGTLTLSGPANGEWLFYVGTVGTGALTGTNFNIVLTNGARACNVTWWVAEAVTMTTSAFVGEILAGAAITFTGGSFFGDAYSRAGITVTGTAVTGCEGSSNPAPTPAPKNGCNQGVGNGPEGCDPGKSNRNRATNDEAGGVPGTPGRKRGA